MTSAATTSPPNLQEVLGVLEEIGAEHRDRGVRAARRAAGREHRVDATVRASREGEKSEQSDEEAIERGHRRGGAATRARHGRGGIARLSVGL